jgi:hypothetical protein
MRLHLFVELLGEEGRLCISNRFLLLLMGEIACGWFMI